MSTSVTERPQAPVDGPKPPRSSHRVLSAVAVVVLLIFGFHQLEGMLPSIHNPFKTTTTDLSQKVMLQKLVDQHEYVADKAALQDVVELKQQTKFIPWLIKGRDTVFIAEGSVESSVDFSHLDASSVVTGGSGGARSVTITLPHATLGDVTVDVNNSHVAFRKSGLLDHVAAAFSNGPSDAKLYQLAQTKLAAAAATDPTIITRAETNTRAFLVGFLAPLGYTDVTVNFSSDSPGAASASTG